MARIIKLKCMDPNHEARKELEGWSDELGVRLLPDNVPDPLNSGVSCDACLKANEPTRNQT